MPRICEDCGCELTDDEDVYCDDCAHKDDGDDEFEDDEDEE